MSMMGIIDMINRTPLILTVLIILYFSRQIGRQKCHLAKIWPSDDRYGILARGGRRNAAGAAHPFAPRCARHGRACRISLPTARGEGFGGDFWDKLTSIGMRNSQPCTTLAWPIWPYVKRSRNGRLPLYPICHWKTGPGWQRRSTTGPQSYGQERMVR